MATLEVERLEISRVAETARLELPQGGNAHRRGAGAGLHEVRIGTGQHLAALVRAVADEQYRAGGALRCGQLGL